MMADTKIPLARPHVPVSRAALYGTVVETPPQPISQWYFSKIYVLIFNCCQKMHEQLLQLLMNNERILEINLHGFGLSMYDGTKAKKCVRRFDPSASKR